jgi:membrane protein implicated in regulation of membrane protease activity
MKEGRPSARVIVRYVLLQLPGMALVILALRVVQGWWDLSWWVFCGTVVVSVAKDVILFPFVWRAYDWDTPDRLSMVGAHGVATERLEPWGYVRIRAELWRAVVKGGGPPIEPGETVRVEGMRGLTLFVRRDGEEGADLDRRVP